MKEIVVASLIAAASLAWVVRVDGATAAAGSQHSALVTTTSDLWTFGYNGYGQLGLGNQTSPRTQPNQVTPLNGTVAAIAAGANHTLVLKSDGTVWAFGDNNYGQLGDGTSILRTSPVQVKLAGGSALNGIIAVAAGTWHSVALKSDGTVVSWGYNGNGQIGDGTSGTNRPNPVAVNTLAGVTAIAAGSYHSLAVTSDGKGWAWGYNGSGQLGDGTYTQRLAPVQVSTAMTPPLVAVAAGDQHSLGQRSDGSLWAWGGNASGQLGDGTTSIRLSPVQVTGVSQVASLSAGFAHSVAVESDGTVHTWGRNNYGQLGDGGTTNSTVPELVGGITDAVAVIAAADHTLAVTSSGIVWTFGRNSQGQLGDGTTVDRWSPVAISTAGFNWKAGTPAFSPLPNTFSLPQSVTLASATAGSTIRYTTDGSEPLASSPVYSSAIGINETTTVKARSFKSGVPDSNVATGTFVLKVATPSISPPLGANQSAPFMVTLSTTSPGATLRYTLDGSEPTAASPPYTAPFTLSATAAVRVKGFRSGWTDSSTSSFGYTFKVATPTLTPGGGSYASLPSVTAATASPGSALHYTTNGQDPMETDPLVTGALNVDHSLTLKVRGWRTGWTPSDLVAGTYLVNLGTVATPVVTPPAGTYTSTQTLTMTCATSGALIHYTLDGADPTLQSPIYAGPFALSSTATVKARAFRADMASSAVAGAAYTLDLGAVETPTVDVPSGTYITSRTVTLAVTTAGATIRYTTTGADPTASDTAVPSGGTVLVDRSLILKARAFKAGLPDSAVVRRDYLVTGMVAAGTAHALALKADGTVVAWGYNASGQLGDLSTISRTTPVAVKMADGSPLTGVVYVAAGDGHSLAVKSDGSVVAWGSDTYGQIGDNTTSATPRSGAVVVRLANTTPLAGAVAVAAGYYHSLALKSDGTVVGWGLNDYGQVGDGTTTSPRTGAVPVSALTGVVALSSKYYTSLALKANGTLYGWGVNSSGQLGDGTTNSPRLTPAIFPTLSGVALAAEGLNHSVAVVTGGQSMGTVWATGYNQYGQLGDSTTTNKNIPVAVLAEVAAVASGGHHTVAMTYDGRLWAWGNNDSGQLGDRGNVPRYSPIVLPFTMGDALQLTASSSFTMVVKSDGTVWIWGYNSQGLGNGGVASPMPAQVTGLTLASNSWLAADTDQDGLTNAAEYRIGTDPLNPDSNANGLSDGVEFAINHRPFDPDPDGDGLANSVERQLGTDPNQTDTDGDGINDGADAFPLDPTRSAATPDPNDHTPPVITIIEPSNAVPLP